MSLSADDIVRIMEKSKELGVGTITVEGMSLSFADHMKNAGFKASSEVPEVMAEDIVTPVSVLDGYTDEELLYYATPRFDELQKAKEERLKQIKEEGRG